MSDMLRFEKVKRLRKEQRCFGCMEKIPAGFGAWAWVAVSSDRGIETVYMHEYCGQVARRHCFGCVLYDDADFHEGWLLDCIEVDDECEAVKEMVARGMG